MKRALRTVISHPRISVAAGVVLAGFVVFILAWFQPQKLFIDDVVNESSVVSLSNGGSATVPPTTDAGLAGGAGAATDRPGPSVASPTTAPATPRVGAIGDFVSRAHGTTGRAAIVVNVDGTRTLRIEDLDTDNGPDLRVVLVPAHVDDRSYDARVELAKLKGNKGSQNYDIPKDLDLAGYRSVVIWCERFRVAFGAAPVAPPV